MKKKHLILLGLLGLVMALMPATAFAGTATATQAKAHTPHVLFQKGHNHNHNQPDNTPNTASAANPTVSTNNLTYHGGPVMAGTMNVYLIFWQPGNMVSSSYQSLITRYFNDVGGSSLYKMGQLYPDSHSNFPSGSQLAGTWVDSNNPYPPDPPSYLSIIFDTDIQAEVTRAQQANGWTSSMNNMFFVFTEEHENLCLKDSAGTIVACTPYIAGTQMPSFCAYHSYFGTNTIYAAMPYNSATFDPACSPEVGSGSLVTPNGDDADLAINLASNEQIGAATDPLGTAWYDANNNEIGDKCAWTFGPVNGQGADVTWNSNPYLVQQEWNNSVSGCTLSPSIATQYYQIVNRNSGLVMDVTGGGTTNGAQVIQWTNHTGLNQEWSLVPDGNTYQIVNRNSGLVLDVYGGGTTSGANVIQWTNHNGLNQQWWLDPNGGYNVIVNVNSSLVANVAGSSTSTGASVIQDNMDLYYKSQQWSLVPVDSTPVTFYVIKNINSSLVMDVYNGSTSTGAQVIQWPSTGGFNQEWSIVPDGSNYQIVNRNSGLVLDVYGGGTTNGAQVIQWTNHNGLNQQWRLLPSASACLSGSVCQIQNVNSGLVLDVYGGGKTQGVNVIQWTNNDTPNQQWTLIPMTA